MADIFSRTSQNIMCSNPVFHADKPWYHERDGDRNAGWYFWNETWSDAEGPFESEASCREACNEYAKNL